MSAALDRVYALQQRELNEKERQRQQQIAKAQRLIAAFNASGIVEIFDEFRNLPLRTDVRQRVYKRIVGELTWMADRPYNQLHNMSFMPINGQTGGPRWWCEENADSGNMRYGYSSGRAGYRDEFFDSPAGTWLNMFIEYLAAAADPNAVAEQMQNRSDKTNNTATATSRRQLQAL